MTREELQQELRKLEEEKKNAMSAHANALCEIEEAQREATAAANEETYKFLANMAAVRRKADSAMRKAVCAEQIRHKAAWMDIESRKQQLFADYKTQNPS